MSDPAFFGYGSLVNTRTHNYPILKKVTLTGWRRVWRPTRLRQEAFLSVEPAPGYAIDGLTAQVPGADWEALDTRETGYRRIDVTGALAATQTTALYQVDDAHLTQAPCVILLSYLDVVVQGYLHQFGPDGIQRFFASTTGWQMSLRNDRLNPTYPRAQRLGADEIALVDRHLASLPVRLSP